MAMHSATVTDPMNFELRSQVTSLLSNYQTQTPSDLASVLSNHNTSATVLLDSLSRLLTIPIFTEYVAHNFRPLLMDLCARWLSLPQLDESHVFESFGVLLPIHHEIHPILCHYLSHPSRRSGPLSFLSPTPIQNIPTSTLHRTLLAYYRILREDRQLADRLGWRLSYLMSLIDVPHPDPGVRLLAIQCYALQTCMGDAQREELELKSLGELGKEDASIECPETLVNDPSGSRTLDGWMLKSLESQRINNWRQTIATISCPFAVSPQISSDDLSSHIVNVSGILLFRRDNSPPPPSTIVYTSKITAALRHAALRLSQRLPIMLSSSSGAGKSTLIQHLAQQTHPRSYTQVVSIHLSDTSIDPKSLLGSYVSSSNKPGTFEWAEGVLTRALREGKWIVFEDIDRASNEVLGTILPLVESLQPLKGLGERAFINVPGRAQVFAEDGFALFATRSVHVTTSNSGSAMTSHPSFLGNHHWSEVIIDAPSAAEQELMLTTRFPRIAGRPIRALISIWESIRALAHAPVAASGKSRDVSLRDLIKWAHRVERLFPSTFHADQDDSMELDSTDIFSNPALKEMIFLEAQDVFFGSIPPSASGFYTSVSTLIAEQLGLSPDRAEWVLNLRAPDLDVEKSPQDGHVLSVRIGRTRLPARPLSMIESLETLSSPRPFALHRPSLLLLEKLAVAANLSEPLLLVGETGTGKTTTIQHLASLLSQSMTVINLSNQTETADLLGGFKPVDARVPGAALQQRFSELFAATFSMRKNTEYGEAVRKAITSGKWKRAIALWRDAKQKAVARIRTISQPSEADSEGPRKRRRVESVSDVPTADESHWLAFEKDVALFEAQHILAKTKFSFSFVEGPLVSAIRAGHWVLLDEINLASPETLEAIAPLLQSPTSSITLTEQGSLEPIPRHPSFRLFASMNPATDVGKKDLPMVLRSNFTEVWVPPPDAVRDALLSIVQQYIGDSAVSDRAAVLDVAEFYEAVRKLAESRQISDGSNQRPHFSMRTLTRALTFASDIAPMFGLRRALWEGCLMAFTMALDHASAELVRPLAEKYILSNVKNKRALLSQIPSIPPGHSSREDYVQVGPFFLLRGSFPLETVDDYILTPSVQTKLIDLSRIVLTRRFPVLIEGPTSAGKTSSIEYLARRTGHRFVRINNHEHTDIQEYIGTYVSDPQTGKLVFQDGILVRALRQGDWIVLDELNLAPTDVLEALNRLLDDNRELLIPETQEIVKPHPDFMLFATQNPPGLYAGRKILSRAFRNRFLEVHFDDVPQAELETILCQRCRIAPSYAGRIVSVFQELQKRRQAGRVFESKQGFATLRDLFRWAGRGAVGYQQLAEDGYMILAERARRPDDKAAVKEAIEAIMKVNINPDTLYALNGPEDSPAGRLNLRVTPPADLVWTLALQRLFILVATAVKYNEPVLLVGETGSGKTSVCQYLAETLGRQLHILNCHQNTETADLLGGQRPLRNRAALRSEAISSALSTLSSLGVEVSPTVAANADELITIIDRLIRSKPDSDLVSTLRELRNGLQRSASLFEWHDGPLVRAMRGGDIFLLDEISLADDSVLERLNSVLEPSRTLVLAEKGGWDVDQVLIRAESNFALVATMNPGGDYGKKELSPALRNRFTEIWVPQVEDRVDRQAIVNNLWQNPDLQPFTDPLLDFADWLGSEVGDQNILGLRDISAWVIFTNKAVQIDNMAASLVFHHAARMTVLDGLGSFSQLATYSSDALKALETRSTTELLRLVPLTSHEAEQLEYCLPSVGSSFFAIGAFGVPLGPIISRAGAFSLEAPTSRRNAMRVLRACQVRKPILLEGSPGVGKTSLIAALADATGHALCRVNLSDQTEIMDLFGSDLPVEGGRPGEFQWKDAAFLRALQLGEWVLLDEMNLAPQAVLEGLNAVLDHRGTVYIPELGRTFIRHPDFRIFAAQNPLQQGGGRKGLPKSFLNRFTKVYVQELNADDLYAISRHAFPQFSPDHLKLMIDFTSCIHRETTAMQTLGREGGPWEFNLRDVLRWLLLQTSSTALHRHKHPIEHLPTVFTQRFRSETDRHRVLDIFSQTFPSSETLLDPRPPWPSITPSHMQFGHTLLARDGDHPNHSRLILLPSQLATLEAAAACIQMGWLIILTGASNSGKTSIARLLAHAAGCRMLEVSLNGAIDTTDLLGGFEQVDPEARTLLLCRQLLDHWSYSTSHYSCSPDLEDSIAALRKSLSNSGTIAREDLIRQARYILARVTDSTLKLSMTSDLDALDTAESTPRFDWIDGPLVHAMKTGEWLLLDNANLCNPAVLDRLNSLCETNGSLTLSERGLVNGEIQVLRPHPAFRLIMTVDPRHGELSRAMRNRGIELAVSPITLTRNIAPLLGLPTKETMSFDLSVIDMELASRGLQSGIHWVSPAPDYAPYTFSTRLYTAPLHTHSPNALEARLSHLIRTTSPTLWRRLRRALPLILGLHLQDELMIAQQIWDDIQHGQRMTSIVAHRSSSDRHDPVLSNFLLSQSLNMTLNVNAACIDWIENGTLSVPTLALELAVRLQFLGETIQRTDESSTLRTSILYGVGHRDALDVHPAVEWLAPLITAARSAAASVSRTPHENTPETLVLAWKLIELSTQLTLVTSQVDFNLTAVRAISSWFITALRDTGDTFGETREFASRIQSACNLTTGHAMSEIWRSGLGLLLPHDNQERLSRFERAIRTLGPGLVADDFRSNIFELMCLLALSPTQVAPRLNEIQALSDNVDVKVSQQLDLPLQSMGHADAIHIALGQLGVLGSSTSNMNASWTWAEAMLALVIQTPGVPLGSLVALRKAGWALNADGDNPTFLRERTSAHISWLRFVSDLFDHDSTKLGGVAVLMRPSILLHTLLASDIHKKSLNLLPEYEGSLSRYQSYAALHTSQEQRSRPIQMMGIFFDTLTIILEAMRPFYDADVSQKQAHVIDSLRDSISAEQLNSLSQLLQASHNPLIRESWMNGVCRVLADRDPTAATNVDFQWVGRCWVALSLNLIELYIPNAPLDPLLVKHCSADLEREREAWVSVRLSIAEAAEALTTGHTSNHFIDELRAQLDVIKTAMHEASSFALPRVPNIPRINSLFTEITQFDAQVLQKIRGLMRPRALPSSEVFLSSETVLQGSIAGFMQRLESVYFDHADIIKPLSWLLSQLQLGLRVCAQHIQQNEASVSKFELQTVRSIISFPSVSSVYATSKASVYRPTTLMSATEWSLHCLAGIEYNTRIGADALSRTNEIKQHYEHLLALWLKDREKERDEALAASSLYRAHKYDESVLSDAQAEEQEFRALFPSFADDDDTDIPTAPTPSKTHVSSEHMVDITSLHLSLFSSTPPQSLRVDSFLERRRAILNRYAGLGHMTAYPASIDDDSLAWRLGLLFDRRAELNTPIRDQKPYDFYRDTNVSEVRKAIPVLRQLEDTLNRVIQQWPDQMVLHHLREHVQKLLNVRMHSSVAQVLAGMEKLLLHTDDWETYANRDNSLKSHQAAIAALIVGWRRLELSCWAQLLEGQTVTFQQSSSEWWFRLYELLVRGTKAASDMSREESNALDEHISRITPLIDEYMRSSPLGQFQTRLDLLSSFAIYIRRLLSSDAHEGYTFNRLANLLVSIISLYQQALPSVQAELAQRRSTIEKEIRDYIKLASWKDVNVHALKQSAERTHRHLHRCVRKFRDILRSPVQFNLLPHFSDNDASLTQRTPYPSHSGSTRSALPPLPPSLNVPASDQLHKLPVILAKYAQILEHDIKPQIGVDASSVIEDLSSLVIATAQELSDEPIRGTGDERQKAAKDLLVRKRRALTDLLQETRRLGIPTHLPQDVLLFQQSRSNLLELTLEEEDMPQDARELASKANFYYYRIINGLQHARDSLRSHHADIPVRELQRALTLVEATYSHGVKARQSLSRSVPAYKTLHQMASRLQHVSEDGPLAISRMDPDISLEVSSLSHVAAELVDALQEVLAECRTISVELSSESTGRIAEQLNLSIQLRDALGLLHTSTLMTSPPLLLNNEAELIQQAQRHFHATLSVLQAACDSEPRLRHLCEPTSAWLKAASMPAIPTISNFTGVTAEPSKELVNSFQSVAQGLHHWAAKVAAEVIEDDNGIVRKKTHSMENAFELLGLNGIVVRLTTFLHATSSLPTHREHYIARIRPFLEMYLGAVESFFVDASHWLKSTLKLAYILCSIVQTLINKGFCQPPEGEASSTGAANGQPLEGTGLGEGTGDDNVSKEIEDESQVEGLQGEENSGPPPPKGEGDDEDAIEMGQDFDADMEDVDQASDDDQEEGDDGSEVELDEQIADVDPTDPNAVDEKMWGDEESQDKPSDGRTEDDRSTVKQTGESELVAKEGDDKKDEAERGEDKSGEGADHDKEEDVEGEEGEEGEEGPPEDHNMPDAGSKLDDHVQDANTLDLPEDLELGNEEADADDDDKGSNAGSTAEDDQAINEDPNISVSDTPMDEQQDADTTELDDASGDPEDTDTAMEEDLRKTAAESKEEVAEETAEEPEPEDERTDEEDSSKPSVSQGANADNGLNQTDDKATPVAEAAPAPSGEDSKSGVNSEAPQHESQDQSEPNSSDDVQMHDQSSNPPSGAQGQADISAPNSAKSPPSQNNPSPPNPLRNLGDALKEIRRRFDEIAERSIDDPLALPQSHDPDPSEDPHQLEYAGGEDEDVDMQALGPSGPEDEASKLRDLHISGDEPPVAPMLENELPELSPSEPMSTSLQHPETSQQDAPSNTSMFDAALTASQIRDAASSPVSEVLLELEAQQQIEEEPEPMVDDLTVEVQLRQWQTSGHPDEQAHQLWRMYESLTHDLAYTLCEQLRLILAPTLATRLKGDYRTGKRLNMKKIIPYIASEYTKDKIWLRRTKPSKREYQVLIALDDSRSMREGRAGHLAFQTMALVIKALERLEAGDVGVARFGETVDVLHGFEGGGRGFSDQDGARVMQNFKFDQRATDVLSLVERSLTVLQDARDQKSSGSSLSSDLWQLEIIISDGICQHHDRLRALLRRATEQRIMIVFVVVDALRETTAGPSSSASSILSMNQAAYTMVNGKMELQMHRYLDTFPFEYYVVLRNVEALPEVLAGTLKQFFERMAED